MKTFLFEINFQPKKKHCLNLDVAFKIYAKINLLRILCMALFGTGFVCLLGGSYVCHGVLSVCAFVHVMFGMGFVCLCVGTSYVWHEVCL